MINFDRNSVALNHDVFTSPVITADYILALRQHSFTIISVSEEVVQVVNRDTNKKADVTYIFLGLESNLTGEYIGKWRPTKPNVQRLSVSIRETHSSWLGHAIEIYPYRMKCFGEQYHAIYLHRVVKEKGMIETYSSKNDDKAYPHQTRKSFIELCMENYKEHNETPPTSQDRERIEYFINVLDQQFPTDVLVSDKTKAKLMGMLKDLHGDGAKSAFDSIYSQFAPNASGEIPDINDITQTEADGIIVTVAGQWKDALSKCIGGWKSNVTDGEWESITKEAFGAVREPKMLKECRDLNDTETAKQIFNTLCEISVGDGMTEEIITLALGNGAKLTTIEDIITVRDYMDSLRPEAGLDMEGETDLTNVDEIAI